MAKSPKHSQRPVGAAAAATFVHAYTVWPARNTFCCWGFITGPNRTRSEHVRMAHHGGRWGSSSTRGACARQGCAAATRRQRGLLAPLCLAGGVVHRPRHPAANPTHLQEAAQPPLYALCRRGARVFTDTWCMTCHLPAAPRVALPGLRQLRARRDHHCPLARAPPAGRNYAFFILFLVSISLSPEPSVQLSGAWQRAGLPARHCEPGRAGKPVQLHPQRLRWCWASSCGLPAYHPRRHLGSPKETSKGRKNGAKRMSVSQRRMLPSWQSEIDPRRPCPSAEWSSTQLQGRPHDQPYPTLSAYGLAITDLQRGGGPAPGLEWYLRWMLVVSHTRPYATVVSTRFACPTGHTSWIGTAWERELAAPC